MAITTTAEYKADRGVGVSGDDTAIGNAITAAQERLERLAGRSFESAARTEYYDGLGSESIQLRAYPVTSITSVQLLNADRTAAETLDSGSYVVNTTTGELRLSPAYAGRFIPTEDYDTPGIITWGTGPQFPDQFQNVKVVYTGGYSSVPTSLKQAIWRIVDWAIRSDKLTIAPMGSGGSSTDDFDKVCWEVAREWMIL